MLDIEKYIESGVLYEYCLNLLSEPECAGVELLCNQYPELKKEVQNIQSSLESYALQSAKWPGEQLKQKIWGTLENINKEKEGDLENLPIINKYSDHNNWKRIVMPFIPKEIKKEDFIVQVLRHTDSITQVLMMGGTEVPDEVHEHEQESFIVLEGECDCYIGDNVIRLGPGGFIDIPLHTHHEVKAITPYVIAIMQRIAV